MAWAREQRRRGAWALIGIVGCTFDSSGLGLGDGSTTDDAESSSTASDTTSSSAPTTGDETTTRSESSTDDGAPSTGTTSEPQGMAVLELVEPLAHGDFGLVTIHESKARAFLVANVGTGPATNLLWSGVTDPFVFVGGTYPGVGGDCEATLAAGDSCTLVLAFEPTALGPFETTLGIHFHDGTEARQVERPLVGAGGGASENLLVNGDAEACSGQGAHPAEWVKVGGGWRCEAAPHSGSFSIYGGESGNGLFALRQDVDVSALAETIDEFGLGFTLAGWARSYAHGDDPYHIDILYLGENAEELAGWTTGVQSSNTVWTLHEHARLAPWGTRVISVRLFCSKDGGSYCDAYFDDLELRAIYPPP